MVNNPTETVLMRLKMSTASQNATYASATVMPKILPPNSNAYVGKIINRLAINATPVAIRQETDNDQITRFNVLRR